MISRLSGFALVAAGILLSLGYVLQEFVGDETSGTLFTVAVTAGIAGVLSLQLGLPGWYAAQRDRAPRLGLVTMLMVFFGMPLLDLQAGVIAAAGVDDDDLPTLSLALLSIGMAAGVLGLVALGAVTWRAGVLPRPAGAMVTLSPLLTYFFPLTFPFDEALWLSVGFAGMVWVGVALIRDSARNSIVPSPALV